MQRSHKTCLEGARRGPLSVGQRFVAGGIPILFLACGRTELADMSWSWAGAATTTGGEHGQAGAGPMNVPGAWESDTSGDTGGAKRPGASGVGSSDAPPAPDGPSGGQGGAVQQGGLVRDDNDSGLSGESGRAETTVHQGTPDAGQGTGLTFPPKFVGNIDTYRSIRPDFLTYWNQFTPENAGKWRSVQPSSPSAFQWSSLDAMYKYCEDNHILFKEHTFVWGNQQPTWTSDLTPLDGPGTVKNWMKSFCDRYPKTSLIDVVNEPPPHTLPPYADAIGGSGNSGWDWIVNSFVWAHEACPNAVLLLNDFNNIEYEADARHTIEIVKTIQKAGAPIDAIGCQTHGALNVPSSRLKANIDRIVAETGLPVYITEYDIDLADDEQQLQQYQEHFPMFWSNENVRGITLWGYVLGRTWETNSGILRSDDTMRPAMSWLMGFLGR